MQTEPGEIPGLKDESIRTATQLIVQREQRGKKRTVISRFFGETEGPWIGEEPPDVGKTTQPRVVYDCREIVEMKTVLKMVRPEPEPGYYKQYEARAECK